MSALTIASPPTYPANVVTLLATGFGDPIITKAHKRHRRTVGAFFVPAARCYGGLAWETFGSAGFLCARFANLRKVTTHLFGDRRGDSNHKGVMAMTNHAQGASAPSLLSRSIAAAHRRMAFAALHADSSASVRLARYNHHMTKARALAGGAA